MASKAFNKEIVRSITWAKGRFISLMLIVALGVGFYCGLRMTSNDMKSSADAFYDATDVMDIQIASTMGLEDADISAIESIDGISAVMPTFETDVIADFDDKPYAVRVHSVPPDIVDSTVVDDIEVVSDDDSYLNRLILVDGNWPIESGQCVVSADRVMRSKVNVGDRISIVEESSEDALAVTEFTVCGLVHSSYYASSTSMGVTSLGSGLIEQFMYVLPEDFSEDYPITKIYASVEGAKRLNSSSPEYLELISTVIDRINAIAPENEARRLDSIKEDALSEIDDGQREFDEKKADAESKLDDAEQKLKDALAKLENGEQQLNAGRKEYESGVAAYEQNRQDADARFAEAESQLDQRQQQLDASKLDLEKKKQELEQSKPYMSPEQIAQAEAAIDAGQAQIDQGTIALSSARDRLNAERMNAYAQLDAAKQKLDAAANELTASQESLNSGRADYDRGLAEYNDSKSTADAELADAEDELNDARAKLDELEMPEWLVMDRSKVYGIESFSQDSDRINSIGQVFPFVFFLVAALVALTTMTRMVEEERVLIGTYKALGYSRRRIMSKYLLYAIAASAIGSVLGIVILSIVLPIIIMHAYSIVYIVPICSVYIDPGIAALSAGLGIGITLIATYIAVAATLRETAASLLLPKAPKAGKRILLERVKPLWNRLSFLWKVTCRNIFRYKSRMFMTIIGIAGCTALLLTGFGLHDALNDIIDIHYSQIVKYNADVTLDEDSTEDVINSVIDEFEGFGPAERYSIATTENMVAVNGDDEVSATVVVPQDIDSFTALHTLRDRLSGQSIELTDDGAIITEKLATLAGVDVGEELTLSYTDEMGNATGKQIRVKVIALVENYVGNSVFMTENMFDRTFEDNDATPNKIYIDSGAPFDERDDVSEAVRNIDGVKTVSFIDETIDSYKKMLGSVNMVVYVLIIAAALLAFIVLYNLTNINIEERKREIATLRVLGFTYSEVDKYIFREILILAVAGALFGLFLGTYLESFVAVTAEVESIMFGRQIHLLSYIFAFVLTLIFSIFVMLVMRRKLKSIDMVESLKSNE